MTGKKLKKESRMIDFVLGNSINDPMFGELVLDRSSSEGHWKCGMIFGPTNELTTLYFFDIESPVKQEQRVFYARLEVEYDSFKDRIAEILRSLYIEIIGPLSEKDVWSEFTLNGITVPSSDSLVNGLFEWDLYYVHNKDRREFLIEMRNWVPVEGYSIQ